MNYQGPPKPQTGAIRKVTAAVNRALTSATEQNSEIHAKLIEFRMKERKELSNSSEATLLKD